MNKIGVDSLWAYGHFVFVTNCILAVIVKGGCHAKELLQRKVAATVLDAFIHRELPTIRIAHVLHQSKGGCRRPTVESEGYPTVRKHARPPQGVSFVLYRSTTTATAGLVGRGTRCRR